MPTEIDTISVRTKHPKVSVCIVTYNQEKYIRQCLQSIMDQETDFDFEVVVGDDCSTDGTRVVVEEFARKYPDVVKPLFREKNIGPTKNYVSVHNLAQGEYVAHLDGDDYVLAGKLQIQVSALDSDPGCVAVWHLTDFFDDHGAFCSGTTADISSFPNGRVSFGDAIRLGYIGVHSSLMYRRSARSLIDPDHETLDLYMTLHLLSKGHGVLLNTVLGCYRVASSGSMLASSRQKVQRLAIEHMKEFFDLYPEHRHDFMIWALSRAMISIKNLEVRSLEYLRFAWLTKTTFNARELLANLKRMRSMQVQWNRQRQLLKTMRI